MPAKAKSKRFKRNHKPTDAILRESFNLYVNAAIRAYRAEEKSIEDFSTQEPEWGAKYGNRGINFPDMLTKGLEEFGPRKMKLVWVCDFCEETDCGCEKHDDDDEDDD